MHSGGRGRSFIRIKNTHSGNELASPRRAGRPAHVGNRHCLLRSDWWSWVGGGTSPCLSCWLSDYVRLTYQRLSLFSDPGVSKLARRVLYIKGIFLEHCDPCFVLQQHSWVVAARPYGQGAWKIDSLTCSNHSSKPRRSSLFGIISHTLPCSKNS